MMKYLLTTVGHKNIHGNRVSLLALTHRGLNASITPFASISGIQVSSSVIMIVMALVRQKDLSPDN